MLQKSSRTFVCINYFDVVHVRFITCFQIRCVMWALYKLVLMKYSSYGSLIMHYWFVFNVFNTHVKTWLCQGWFLSVRRYLYWVLFLYRHIYVKNHVSLQTCLCQGWLLCRSAYWTNNLIKYYKHGTQVSTVSSLRAHKYTEISVDNLASCYQLEYLLWFHWYAILVECRLCICFNGCLSYMRYVDDSLICCHTHTVMSSLW